MNGVALDWSSAEVRDGKFEVGLRGELPAGFKDGFDRTVALLPSGGWGTVELKKQRIRVDDVAEGCEDRLRHFLESVVLQANASAEPSETEAHDEDDADHGGLSERDVTMTERFRSFAPDGEDEGG
jgi:hypothetical protein